MIKEVEGRYRSERSRSESIDMLKNDIAHMSKEEREALDIVLEELRNSSTEPGLMQRIESAEYKRPLVDMKTFVMDSYYLGATCYTLYPKLLKDLEELFSGGYHEAIWTGSIGSGKTFVASIGICRVLYELSCMANPHMSFGIAPDSNISILGLSVNALLAQKVVFENVASKISSSPYFKEHFPFEETKTEMRFPNNIWVAARATTDTSALGLNVIAALVDEVNDFHRVSAKDAASGATDRAETIYNALKRRIKSRFEKQGRNPGMIFVVSSKKTSSDFTAKRIKESLNDSSIFVRDYATWDLRPESFDMEHFFYVLVGNESTPSKIVEVEEEASIRKAMGDGCKLIKIPNDFRRDFERDLEGNIRDTAGMATVASHPFISRRDKIQEAIDPKRRHPFSVQIYDPSKGGSFIWDQMVRPTPERGFSQNPSSPLRAIINPRAVRHIHIDPSLRGDATGFCMAHVGGYKDVERRTDEGILYHDKAPIYVVDFMLRIVPPVGDEIVLAELRSMIYALNSHGYMISHVSLDQFQSEDSIQQLNTKGFNAERISVDITTEPYENLKIALYENRVSYYEYSPLMEELQQLEKKFDGRKTKIDHQVKGKKDVSDALAACLFTLSKSQVVEPLPFMRSTPDAEDNWMRENGTRRPQATKPIDPLNVMLPSFIKGGGDDGGWDGNNGGGWGNM